MSIAEALQRLVFEGDALVKAGRFAEGEARAHEVLSRQPRHAGGHYLLGLSAFMQERHAEALPHFEAALRVDRVNAQLHFMVALCQAALDRTEDAIASYRRVVQYRPDFLEARANLAYLYERVGKVAEAVDGYERVLALDPNEWFSLSRLGYCARVLGRPADSVEWLRKSLALRPDFAATHNELALSLIDLERPEEAIASLRRAVEAEPGFAQGWANLAKLLYVRHLEALQHAQRDGTPAPDAAPVIECFDRLSEFDPANAEFRHLRDSVAGARVDRAPDSYVQSFFDRFAPRFDVRLVDELRYAAPEVAARLLAPRLAGRTVLAVVDLGCGTGLSGGFLRPHAASLVGVDLSGAMLELARARGIYDELVREEIGAWLARRDPASVDLAVALDVFIYVGDLARVLHAAAAALASGGLLAFSIEDLPGDGGDFALLPAGRYAHARGYVEEAAKREGLALIECEAFDIRHEAGRAVPARLYAFAKT